MSRTAVGITAGVLVASCVVAILPAQEAARKRPPTTRVYSDDELRQPDSGLMPVDDQAVGLMPVDSPAGGSAADLSRQLQSAGQQAAQEYGGPPATFAVGTPAAPDNSIPADPTAPTIRDEEGGQLRSVLKGRSAAVPSPAALPNAYGADSLLGRPAVAPTAPVTSHYSDEVAPASDQSLPRRPPPRTSISAGGPAATLSRPMARSIQDLSLSGRSPALRVDVAGPQGIALGKPASYVVHVTNESDTTAEEVLVRVAFPGYVEVTGTQPSDGEASTQMGGQGAPSLVWSLPRVAARGNASLRLELVASEGDAFELAVEWTARPVALRAAITIKQPQLELALTGPAEMIFGEEKGFTLTVANPGNGDAEQVVVNIASGTAPAQAIEVGQIPAGAKRELPLQIVGSQPGLIELKATATGEGGLIAETTGTVNVRKAELNITVDAPQLKFAGNEATYIVQITNAGNASADDVQLALNLPSEAKYLAGVDGAVVSPGAVKWRIATLPPGSTKTYEVRLQLMAQGLNRLVVQSQAHAAGTASAEAQTKVEAVADLKLVVADPAGPIATDEQAVYELHVMNRGTRAAEQVRIVMQFGEGLEPIAFEGCEARIVPGQILCQPLPQLRAGEQVKLRIRAQAQSAGTHQFRVEVTSTGDDTRLVSEGTTRFFANAGRSSSANRTAQKPTLVPTPAVPGTLR